ncbi:MAG: type VI secretion system ATPase TssH [Deltaproteobacteria bacterium]|jgi:type VI secretion system protein VasG|nr:type VI secretion system ATPase TssH [Deltaproteobacteria bacterium]
MLNINLASLVAKLDETTRAGLEGAAESCVSRGGQEIGIEDFFEKIQQTNPFHDICGQFNINLDIISQLLEKGRKRAGKYTGRPVFSVLLVEFLQEAYLFATLELNTVKIDVGILVLTLLSNPLRYSVMPFYQELFKISPEKLRTLWEGHIEETKLRINLDVVREGGFLAQFANDLTKEAKGGIIDPVFARGGTIRQVIDILTRRRKNNPILVGDPGVGKTAVAEGLALKIALNDVPEALLNVRLISLDMGRLAAGASVKGEFERRLKGVIDEVKSSPVPIVVFIDEAHTLIGAGNTPGMGDGANLLKPALARGELRTLAATTWSEYKKYFEKDAALARRFQLVKLDEPTPEETVTILRGLVPSYEKSHQVYVRDEAVVSIAELSERYISGRYLPDKAIDVLDTVCARVKVSLGAKPASLEALEEELGAAKRALSALERDGLYGNGSYTQNLEEYLPSLRAKIASLNQARENLDALWHKELDLALEIIKIRTLVADKCGLATNTTPIKAQMETPIESLIDNGSNRSEDSLLLPSFEPIAKLMELRNQLGTIRMEKPLVFFEVDVPLVTEVISEWTGVPMEKLMGQSKGIENFGARLRKRIRGQEIAVRAIEKAVLTVFSGLEEPTAPNGVFLLVGPSGVGKTETALAVADELFGGERFLIKFNMSEFQEKHTVSRLIGSPPGYVGYGEGGRLTEAVRRQPYSAVLFDEVEKAHPDILNLFYQIFDKGVLADGEGREVDFRNTIIFMTSNLGGDIITALYEEGEPSEKVLDEALRPVLNQFFKPALLGRLSLVPYAPIAKEIFRELVEIRFSVLKDRFWQSRGLNLQWTQTVIDSIAESCVAVESGARNIDRVLNDSLLPNLSGFALSSVNDGARTVEIDLNKSAGTFTFKAS